MRSCSRGGGSRKSRNYGVFVVGVAFLIVFGTAFVARAFDGRTEDIPGVTSVGAEECLTCHEDVQGHDVMATAHAECESCHGGGSKHADSQEPADIRFPRASDCLACHEEGKSTHLEWRTSQHARAGVTCADCHNSHNRAIRNIRKVSARYGLRTADDVSAMCVTCHTDVAARLSLPSHHPIREGALSCKDCHDPHGDSRTRLGEQSERCAGCHQDFVGPWVYEHPPAVEDCTICHDPHGSASRNMLAQMQPVVCLQCHSLADDRHDGNGEWGTGKSTISSDYPTSGSNLDSRGAGVFDCTQCHGAIHGSHRDKHLRR